MIFQTLLTEGKINIDQTKFMFGHSLGEYTALACSNKISLKDCSLILKKGGINEFFCSTKYNWNGSS